MTETTYVLKITASGAVHDKDGNLVNGDMGGTQEVIVTEAQARELGLINSEEGPS